MNNQESSEVQHRLERLREIGYQWDLAVKELSSNGFAAAEIAAVARHWDLWKVVALRDKQKGLPYVVIIGTLREMLASWADVASALMGAGLSSPDMLRVVLPFTETRTEAWETVQVALRGDAGEASLRESLGVLRYLDIDAEEAISHFRGADDQLQSLQKSRDEAAFT